MQFLLAYQNRFEISDFFFVLLIFLFFFLVRSLNVCGPIDLVDDSVACLLVIVSCFLPLCAVNPILKKCSFFSLPLCILLLDLEKRVNGATTVRNLINYWFGKNDDGKNKIKKPLKGNPNRCLDRRIFDRFFSFFLNP